VRLLDAFGVFTKCPFGADRDQEIASRPVQPLEQRAGDGLDRGPDRHDEEVRGNARGADWGQGRVEARCRQRG
jgi:hypothetical protein